MVDVRGAIEGARQDARWDDGRDARIVEVWADALWRFYLTLRAERAAELRGTRRAKAFVQGVHAPSTEWGQVQACEQLLPGLAELREHGGTAAWPHTIRRDAYREAEEQFLADATAGTLDFTRAGDD